MNSPADTPDMPTDSDENQLSPGILGRIVGMRTSERRALVLSFLMLFFIFCCYYILRPIRDEISAERPGILAYLYTGTFFANLIAMPVYVWLTKRLSRRAFIAIAYRFFGLNILAFASCIAFLPDHALLWVECTFFVWISVFNFFVITIFWSFMADVWTKTQSKRLFGFIAGGASLGGLVGSGVTAALVQTLGIVWLLVIAAVILEFGVQIMRRVDDGARQVDQDAGKPLGGGMLSALRAITRSPLLLAICGYIFIYTLGSTFLYFQQSHIFNAWTDDRDLRRSVLGAMDFGVNLAALVLQIGFTGRIVKRIGLAAALSIVPIVTVVGFCLLGVWPVVGVVASIVVVRRITNFALAKPCREMLFTLVTRQEKYQSKPFIDTVVYRGGDVINGYFFDLLSKVMGLGLSATAFVAAPLVGLALPLAVFLGRAADQAGPKDPHAPES